MSAIWRVESLSFDGSLRKSWECSIVADEPGYLLLVGRFDADVNHPQIGLIKEGTRSLEYFFRDRWWNVFEFSSASGQLEAFYCNISMPPVISAGRLSFIDLDVDLLVSPNGAVRVLDREEFEENAVRLSYPRDFRSKVEDSIAELTDLIRRRAFPFERLMGES